MEEAGEFWDTHSAADYWDQIEDVDIEVDLSERRFAVLLDDALYRAAEKRAKAKRIPLGEFINEMLRNELKRATR